MTAARSSEMTATLVDIPLVDPNGVEHLCDFSTDFEGMQQFQTPQGMRLTAIVKSGRVEGPRISGESLPGGGDWIVVGPDRVAVLDVGATIKTEDGEHIFETNRGRVTIPPETAAKFYAGAMVASNKMVARSAPRFETGSEKPSSLRARSSATRGRCRRRHLPVASTPTRRLKTSTRSSIRACSSGAIARGSSVTGRRNMRRALSLPSTAVRLRKATATPCS